MKPKVYLETTITSYLAARQSRDIIVRSHQAATLAWWNTRRNDFELLISEAVLDEIQRGDPRRVARRVALVRSLKVVDTTALAAQLARDLVVKRALPSVAAADALHIGVATANGVDFLLYWNFRHIVNAQMPHRIEQVCSDRGFAAPTICTPEELMGD